MTDMSVTSMLGTERAGRAQEQRIYRAGAWAALVQLLCVGVMLVVLATI